MSVSICCFDTLGSLADGFCLLGVLCILVDPRKLWQCNWMFPAEAHGILKGGQWREFLDNVCNIPDGKGFVSRLHLHFRPCFLKILLSKELPKYVIRIYDSSAVKCLL